MRIADRFLENASIQIMLLYLLFYTGLNPGLAH